MSVGTAPVTARRMWHLLESIHALCPPASAVERIEGERRPGQILLLEDVTGTARAGPLV